MVPGTTTHHLTMYRAPSGALVFGAGSVQWTWGLDAEHDSPYAPEPADPRMQQAQVNLFADMGVQPTTLMTGLVTATKSTDTVGPTTTITTPAAGANRANGAQLTVTGTATDAGGGRVAAVEVSMDDGDTWHPATGTSSWTYSAVQHGVALREHPGAGRRRQRQHRRNRVTGGQRHLPLQRVRRRRCPRPRQPTTAAAVELGLRFTPDVDGVITGVRFYKGTGQRRHATPDGCGARPGPSSARSPSRRESATGWQTATFASPCR